MNKIRTWEYTINNKKKHTLFIILTNSLSDMSKCLKQANKNYSKTNVKLYFNI